MKKKIALLFSLCLPISSMAVAASLSPMDKSQLQNALSDKTITTISAATLDGKVIPDSFTGYYSSDGKASGKFANKPAEGPQADQGTWKIKENGLFCYTWEHWTNGKEQCVSFYKLNNGLLVINAKKDFESLILNDQIKSGNQM